MRNRTSIQLTIVIILLSVFTIVSEFILLHFMDQGLHATLISSGILLLVTLLLLFTSYHYEVIFLYLLLNVILSSSLVAYQFWEIDYFYYSITNYELWLIGINFFVPCICCFICNLFGSSHSIPGYPQLFRNSTILFLLYYVAITVDVLFFPDTSSVWYHKEINYVPFYTIAGYIEDYIYGIGDLHTIFLHLLTPILFFVPSGFLLGLALRRKNYLLRILIQLLLPSALELIGFFAFDRFLNVDYILYGFLGNLLGSLFFFLVNQIHHFIQGKEFLAQEHTYISILHF